MLARNAFVLIFAAVFCAVLVSSRSTDDDGLLKQIVLKLVEHRAFQHNRAKIQLEMFTFDLKRKMLDITSRTDEVTCINKAVDQAVNVDAPKLIADTIDTILPKLDAMKDIVNDISSSQDQWQEVEDFAYANSYEEYKRACMKNFDKALITWLSEKEKVFQACIKK